MASGYFGYGADEVSRRIRAISFQIKCALELELEGDEMAELYRKGRTFVEIAKIYDIANRFNSDDVTATRIVHYRVQGNENPRHGPVFEGYFSDGERERLALEHMKRNGLNAKTQKIGVYGLSKKGLSKAGLAGIAAQGKVKWGAAERRDAASMGSRLEYQRGSTIAISKIARALNDKYHQGEEVRTKQAISHFFKQVKRRAS